MENISYHNVAPGSPGQVVAYTGTAGTIANAVPSGATKLWIFVTSAAHVKISKGGTSATTADFPLPASVPIIVDIAAMNDGTVKVSAIQSATGGNLHVCPVAY